MLRGFSAPVKMKFHQSDEDLALIMVNCSSALLSPLLLLYLPLLLPCIYHNSSILQLILCSCWSHLIHDFFFISFFIFIFFLFFFSIFFICFFYFFFIIFIILFFFYYYLFTSVIFAFQSLLQRLVGIWHRLFQSLGCGQSIGIRSYSKAGCLADCWRYWEDHTAHSLCWCHTCRTYVMQGKSIKFLMIYEKVDNIHIFWISNWEMRNGTKLIRYDTIWKDKT